MANQWHKMLPQTGALSALRHYNLAIYTPFSFLASIGFWIQRISIQWLTWQLTESFFWLGGIVFIEAIAIILVTPAAGVWVDQFSRVLIARITRGASAFVTLLMAVFMFMGIMNLPVLIICTFLAGLADGAWTSARLAIVPNLVPRSDMANAISLQAILFQSTQFIGPALAGIIIKFLGVGMAFLTTSILLLGVVWAFFLIKLDKSTKPFKKESFSTRITDALSYISQRPGIFRLLLFMAIFSFCLRPYKEFYAGFADGIFSMGPSGLAILASASGIGAFLSAIFMGFYSKPDGMTKIVFISGAMTFVSMLIYAISPTFPVVVLGAFGLGFSQTLIGIGAQILLQHAVDDEKRGRVMSLWGLQLRAVPSVGGFTIGIFAAALDIRIALVIFAAAFALASYLYIWPHKKTIEGIE